MSIEVYLDFEIFFLLVLMSQQPAFLYFDKDLHGLRLHQYKVIQKEKVDSL